MQLFLVTLTDQTKMYVVSNDEFDARATVNSWISKRYFAGNPVAIATTQTVAETGSKGFVPNLLL